MDKRIRRYNGPVDITDLAYVLFVNALVMSGGSEERKNLYGVTNKFVEEKKLKKVYISKS